MYIVPEDVACSTLVNPNSVSATGSSYMPSKRPLHEGSDSMAAPTGNIINNGFGILFIYFVPSKSTLMAIGMAPGVISALRVIVLPSALTVPVREPVILVSPDTASMFSALKV